MRRNGLVGGVADGEQAFFYACGMFSGTISGLLAYAISFMDGAAGLAGWRWVS